MPKLYTRNTWNDEVLASSPKYNISGSATNLSSVQIDLATAVNVTGTPLTASVMNNIENGINTLDNALLSGTFVPATPTYPALNSYYVTGSNAQLNGAYQPSGTAGQIPLYDGVLTSATGAIVVYPLGSIPQTFRKLELEISVRTNRANTFDGVFFKANGDSGSNYTVFLLWHNFDSQSNDAMVSQAPTGTFAFATAANAPANVFGFYLVSFPYYADTGRRKDFQSRGGQLIGTGTTQMFIYDAVGNWNSLTGITGLVLYSDTGNSFVSGTRWTLWGLR